MHVGALNVLWLSWFGVCCDGVATVRATVGNDGCLLLGNLGGVLCRMWTWGKQVGGVFHKHGSEQVGLHRCDIMQVRLVTWQGRSHPLFQQWQPGAAANNMPQ